MSLFSATQRIDALAFAARFLDADDAFVRGEFRGRLRQQIASGAARHVVQNDRQAALLGDVDEMPAQSLLRGTHVIRRHDQRRIGAEVARAARDRNRLARIRVAGAGEHRNASADMLHREREQAVVFVIVERVRFAGRSGDDERLRARVDLDSRAARRTPSGRASRRRTAWPARRCCR